MTVATLPTANASGLRKAAVALVALGPERASTVLAGLDEDEVKLIATEIARLGNVTPAEVVSALGELSRGVFAVAQLPAPGKRFAKDVLVRALGPDRGAAASAELDRPTPFSWLSAADPDAAAKALSAEPSGAIALALAHADPRTAAALLVRLPATVRAAVATRVAGLTTVHPETVAHVERDLKSRVAQALTPEVQPVRGPQLLADVLSKAGRDVSREVLTALAATDEALADATRAALFTFEDLCAMEQRPMQLLLRELDMRQLGVALAGTDEVTQSNFTSNLSERSRETLLEEIDLARDSRATDIQVARTEIIATARRLEDEGVLTLTRDGDE